MSNEIRLKFASYAARIDTPEEFAKAIALSAGFHVALILVIFLAALYAARPKPAVVIYSIDIVDTVGVPGSAAPKQEVKPKEEPKQEEEKKAPLEKTADKVTKSDLAIDRKSRDSKKTKVDRPKKEEHKKTEPPAKTQADTKIQKDAGPGTGAEGIPGKEYSGKGKLMVDTRKFPYPWYLQSVIKKVNQNWVTAGVSEGLIPGAEYKPMVQFTINRDGTISGVGIEKSSGDAALDITTTDAVIASGQFPPLPDGYPDQSLTIHYEFTYVKTD